MDTDVQGPSRNRSRNPTLPSNTPIQIVPCQDEKQEAVRCQVHSAALDRDGQRDQGQRFESQRPVKRAMDGPPSRVAANEPASVSAPALCDTYFAAILP